MSSVVRLRVMDMPTMLLVLVIAAIVVGAMTLQTRQQEDGEA